MNIQDLQFSRNFGDAEKDMALNLLKTISEATDGRIGFDPQLIVKVQTAHNVLQRFRAKKATEKQLLDVFASVGLGFYHWITSTHNQLAIEAVEDATADPLGTLDDVEGQEAAADQNLITRVEDFGEAVAKDAPARAIAQNIADHQASEEIELLPEAVEALKAVAEAADKTTSAVQVPDNEEEPKNLFGIRKKR